MTAEEAKKLKAELQASYARLKDGFKDMEKTDGLGAAIIEEEKKESKEVKQEPGQGEGSSEETDSYEKAMHARDNSDDIDELEDYAAARAEAAAAVKPEEVRSALKQIVEEAGVADKQVEQIKYSDIARVKEEPADEPPLLAQLESDGTEEEYKAPVKPEKFAS